MQVREEDIVYLGVDSEAPELNLKRIKDIDASERPYEKAKEFGMASLSNPDLLAIILRSGTPGSPITHTCKEIMRTFGNAFRTLNRASFEDLRSFKGVGEVKAMQILAILEIIRRFNREDLADLIHIKTPQDMARMMTTLIGAEPIEHIYAACLSQSMRLLKLVEISRGLATASVFDVKPIIKAALAVDAQGIMLCHNHPSGNMTPSPQDDRITREISDACRILKIRFLDHVIVGGGSTDNPLFYSYYQEGKL